ncbi:MAG: DNA recombination protein RmuC [Oscillospiraceae bacterium]|nr:DNA recombination protein RmuC [Oscillospiraceae bacterium]
MEYIIIGLLLICIGLLIVLLGRKPKTDVTVREDLRGIEAMLKASNELSVNQDKALREEISGALSRGQSRQAEDTERLTQSVIKQLTAMNETTASGLEKVRLATEQRLDKLQGVVDEKLSKTLNERLESNFKQIGDSVGELYKSLGELKNLSGGVSALNRTLSNVKTRGVWGEQQLGAILEQTMTPAQYDINFIKKRGSNDRFEFAIKMPNKG